MNSGLTSADSGLQLDLEITLGDVQTKDQPHGLRQPGQRCVETSAHVIEQFYLHSHHHVKLFSVLIKRLVICSSEGQGEQLLWSKSAVKAARLGWTAVSVFAGGTRLRRAYGSATVSLRKGELRIFQGGVGG